MHYDIFKTCYFNFTSYNMLGTVVMTIIFQYSGLLCRDVHRTEMIPPLTVAASL